ncbi:MAG: hypothetical protein J7L38_02160 [Thermoproteales archaeon]|nr:hypothetical protein [Thermoproteales archaeon]RLE64688.1 MAG: hypothetical protein DRJ47_07090 [Thermoprotei archaeon]
MSGKKCSVEGCDKPSYKTVAFVDFKAADLKLDVQPSLNKVHLCKEHYKEYKKAVKKLRQYDRWRRFKI